MSVLTFDSVSPTLGGQCLYPGIDLAISPGEIIAIMGVSGIGKSMLLSCISDRQAHTGKITNSVGFFSVFQDQSQLFPWMTIKRNLEISLSNNNWKQNIAEWNLEKYLDRYPYQLSVGQKQRWVLFRALGRPEPLLLCDEPLSAVDGITKLSLARDFRKKVKSNKRSVLWITHDVLEAQSISDRILILRKEQHVWIDPTLPSKSILDEIY